MVLNRPQDSQTLALHLKKIDLCKKAVEVAEQSHRNLESLYNAGRVDGAMLFGGEARVGAATIDLIDAQVALAKTGLLSATQPTMADTDKDGLPDMVHAPLDVNELLTQKVALLRKVLEHRTKAHKEQISLHQSGRRSPTDVAEAAQLMFEAEIDVVNARLELRSLQSADAR